MFSRDRWARAIRVVGWLLIVLSLLPSWSHKDDGVHGARELQWVMANPNGLIPGQTEFTLGWPRSPLYHFRKELWFYDEGNIFGVRGDYHQSVEVISLSFATLLLGIGLLASARAIHGPLLTPLAGDGLTLTESTTQSASV
jgi:hypothetical protein